MTAKNHHIVRDCLIGTERACLWASVQHKAFAGVASHIRWTLLQHHPFPMPLIHFRGKGGDVLKKESPWFHFSVVKILLTCVSFLAV